LRFIIVFSNPHKPLLCISSYILHSSFLVQHCDLAWQNAWPLWDTITITPTNKSRGADGGSQLFVQIDRPILCPLGDAVPLLMHLLPSYCAFSSEEPGAAGRNALDGQPVPAFLRPRLCGIPLAKSSKLERKALAQAITSRHTPPEVQRYLAAGLATIGVLLFYLSTALAKQRAFHICLAFVLGSLAGLYYGVCWLHAVVAPVLVAASGAVSGGAAAGGLLGSIATGMVGAGAAAVAVRHVSSVGLATVATNAWSASVSVPAGLIVLGPVTSPALVFTPFRLYVFTAGACAVVWMLYTGALTGHRCQSGIAMPSDWADTTEAGCVDCDRDAEVEVDGIPPGYQGVEGNMLCRECFEEVQSKLRLERGSVRLTAASVVPFSVLVRLLSTSASSRPSELTCASLPPRFGLTRYCLTPPLRPARRASCWSWLQRISAPSGAPGLSAACSSGLQVHI
jgi:hypothetical protein